MEKYDKLKQKLILAHLVIRFFGHLFELLFIETDALGDLIHFLFVHQLSARLVVVNLSLGIIDQLS